MKKTGIYKKAGVGAFVGRRCFFSRQFLFAVAVNVFTASQQYSRRGALTGLATMINYLFGGPYRYHHPCF